MKSLQFVRDFIINFKLKVFNSPQRHFTNYNYVFIYLYHLYQLYFVVIKYVNIFYFELIIHQNLNLLHSKIVIVTFLYKYIICDCLSIYSFEDFSIKTKSYNYILLIWPGN